MTDEELARKNHEFRVNDIAELRLSKWSESASMIQKLFRAYDRAGITRPTEAEIAAAIARKTGREATPSA